MKIIKITATWCPSCLVMRSRWNEITKKLPTLDVTEYDFDKDTTAVGKYDINDSILPTYIFFNSQDEEVVRLHGEQTKRKILGVIVEVLSKETGKSKELVEKELGLAENQKTGFQIFKKFFHK